MSNGFRDPNPGGFGSASNPDLSNAWKRARYEDYKAGRGEFAGMAGGGGGADDYVSNLIKTLTGEVVPQALEFDTEAARAAAEEEWGPYYEELLQDYLAEVAIGKTREEENLATYLESLGLRGTRAETDVADLLGLLGGRREEYMADIARESPLIQEQIGGTYADRGLYFGGEREEKQRLQLEEEARKKEAYEREFGYKVGKAQAGLGREKEDIERQEEARRLESERYMADVERKRKQRERDLAREREKAITGQVETARYEKYAGFS